MKKLLSVLLTIAMLIPATAFADNDEIKVFLDGEQIQFDVQPIIENDSVLVPMRAIFEAMNKKVTWVGITDSAWAEDEHTLVYFWADGESKYITKSDIVENNEGRHLENARDIEINTPARIVEGRTLVPLRAVSEAFDCDVVWDGDTRTVTITSEEPIGKPAYTEKLMSQLPQGENYVVSPFSLKMAMMMAANGAEDETQKEILDAFGIKDINGFNAYSKQLISDLNADEKAEVNIANSIWFNKDIGGKDGDFSDAFKSIVEDSFAGNAEAVTNKNSVERVNEWTEEQTKGKIKNLLSEDNREYLAALVNAVYMKAEWENQFKKEATYKETFTDINGKENEIDFMHQTSYFDYYEDGDTKIIKLPYTNDMSMYVVLGNTENIAADVKKMTSKKAALSLPKFKLDYSVSLNGILNNMGVVRAFENTAQFSPMVQNTFDVKIDTVLQKAFIEVDEKGTEAAAATAVIIDAAGMLEPEEIVEFKADKPFTYYIADDKYGEVLFAGRYVKPE